MMEPSRSNQVLSKPFLKKTKIIKCLFTFNFCVCDVKNTIRCSVTYQTAFYIMEPTKKLSLKRNFYEVVFTCFFNRVS